MKYLETRRAIIDACLWMESVGMVIGTWGNVSVRLDDKLMMVTPSRIDYADLKPEDMVIVDMEGTKVEGAHNPTSEMHVHRLIYVKRPDVGAVVHCHPVYASAMCAAKSGIPPIFEEMSQMIGGEIPITSEYVNAGQHIKLGEVTAEALGDKNAVLIRNHAPVCVGRDLKEALTCCQVTEKAAKCYLALKGGVEITTIPDDRVDVERHRFLHSYGKEK
ncbi:MAG: class II aldolase/adducin family protein [Eubacterium sp.]